MTKEEAIATLRGYNEWRRYDGPVGEGPTQPEPKTIGEAIDTVCDALERQENLPSDLDEAAGDFVWEVMEEDYAGPSELSKKLRPSSKISDYYDALAEFFKAGARWQKKLDEEAIKTAEDHAFLAGADWQKEQFEKNRLAHCDKLTKEEYDLETDFATEIIEKQHRQPTFTDAINYGMRVTKEYLMKEAVEGFFIKSIDGDVVFAESTALDVDPKSVKVGDKVKLIVIKAEEE